MGDRVDNVPGHLRHRPEDRSKLIQDYGSLTAALDAAPDMKPGKLRERLIEGGAMAELAACWCSSRKTARCRWRSRISSSSTVPQEPLAAFLTAHGFTSLLSGSTAARAAPTGRPSSTRRSRTRRRAAPRGRQPPAAARMAGGRPLGLRDACRSLERLEHWIARAFAARAVAIDTETSILDAMRAELTGISLALGPNDACYIPLGHGGSDMFAEKPVQVDKAAALSALKPLLESDAVLKVGQNIKYDINIFARNGIHVAPVDDTMIISFDLDAGRSEDGIGGGHGMDELAGATSATPR